jgi:hypothetical protein
MGLLDGNMDYGLLGAASGLLTPISQGGGFGAAAQGLMRGKIAMDERAHRDAQMKMLEEYRKAQMEEMAAQTEERKAKNAAAQAQRDALGGMIPQQSAQIPPNFSMQAPGAQSQTFMQQPKIDANAARRAIAAGVDPAKVKAMMEADSLGMPEAAREVEVPMPGGGVGVQLIDKQGRAVGQPIPKAVKMEMANQGDRLTPWNPYSPPSSPLPINMTPGETARNQIDQAQLGISRGNLGVAQANLGLRRQEMEAGKWTNDLERGVQVNMATGQTRPMMAGDQPLGMKPGKPTEDQSKSGMFLKMMLDAERTMQSAGADAKAPTARTQVGAMLGAIPGVGSVLGNVAKADDRLKVEQAQQQWADAYLRMTTGAQAPKHEVEAAARMFFPQYGEGGDVAARKDAARKTAMEAVQGRAGPAGQGVDMSTGGKPGKTVTRSGMYNGKRVVQYSDGSIDYAQ